MDWVGRVIDGRYAVESIVGAGGMGVVLAARHKFTGARVAVKMMRRDLGIDPAIEARFLAEARVPTAIDHRGVVKTLDGGKTPEGELYIVMELLAGQSLRVDMQRGAIGLAQVRRIGMELLDVLAAAHARGIIHRDVKPENVMLVEPGGAVKLLDFGITKLLTAPHSVLPRTAAGVFLGTVAYMAPEQLADARTVDARADLWSVGVLLYELIAGRRPYRATTVEEALVALVKSEPDPIKQAFPQATPDVEAFFARALARDPQQRFASAGEMAQAFARLSMLPALPAAAGAASGSLPYAATAASPPAGLPMMTQATGFTPPAGAARMTPAHAAGMTPPRAMTPVPAAPSPVATPLPVAPAATSTDLVPRSGGRGWMIALLAAVVLLAGAGAIALLVARHPSAPAAASPGSAIAAAAPGSAAPVAGTPATSGTAADPPASPASATAKPSTVAPGRANRVAAGSATAAAAGSAGSVAAGTAGPVGSPGPRPVDPYASPTPSASSTAGANATRSPNVSQPAAADTCTAGCKLLASCHLGTRTCEADCAANGLLHGCLQQAGNDCNRFAACWFAASCGGAAPTGTHSCSEAMDCEATCQQNQTCLCTCIAGLAPGRAATLLGFNGCALPCRDDVSCIAQHCDSQARRCRAQ